MLDIDEVKSMCDKQKDKEPICKSKYFTSAIVSLIIGVIYSSGFLYTFKYLSYFHLYNIKSLSIPPSYYIANAAVPIAITSMVLLLYLAKKFWSSSLEPTLKADVHKSEKKELFKVISIVFVLFIIVTVSIPIGQYKAKGITEGNTIITFTWAGNPPDGIENKELAPIFHHDGIYYVTERMKPAPKNPIVYVIPENQVKSAVINVINNDNISKSSSMQKYNN